MEVSLAYWAYLAVMLLALAASLRWHGKRYLGAGLILLAMVMAGLAPLVGSIL